MGVSITIPLLDNPLRDRLRRFCNDTGCCRNLGALLRKVDEDAITAQVATHAALADPTRLRAMHMLQAQPGLCGCELQVALGLTHATISHHMQRLLDAGLVNSEKRGKWTHYRLTKRGERVIAT